MRSMGWQEVADLGNETTAALGLQVFPQRARPTMPKNVQGLEAAAELRRLVSKVAQILMVTEEAD